ncbi:STAS domain-containing protein [Planococcus shenhongbingii]|uniref:STAS domain-containing protein n=1 Tax=Planococcus shenhongbingii TaxID=3058398 RepID=A0ABT8NEZ4_9BACL|nr:MULTISPECIES: STAS domain-containing protein [unclassified Planococcus (in: firmicutes)]MDN7246474.1 STAS domain-containing protein [Planococcus sp. N017]WKA59465.1 STAS domain-containing protein [Planococcus sp. N016]
MAQALENSKELKTFFENNREDFEEHLLSEAVNVKEKIDEILAIGNIDLISNAHKLVVFIIDGQEEQLNLFAKQEGIAWATHSIALTFKLEWIQAIRRTLWKFIEHYNLTLAKKMPMDFFRLEEGLNSGIDTFLNTFFINYSTYKDSLILAHRQLVENLSVPIIPINASVCILPLIGSVDSFRTNILEEKVLTEIGRSRIQTLIIDLSGIADMEIEAIHHLMKIIDGTAMMGCKSIITGLRTEVVRKMIQLDLSFDQKTKTLGTLQQALKEYLIV